MLIIMQSFMLIFIPRIKTQLLMISVVGFLRNYVKLIAHSVCKSNIMFYFHQLLLILVPIKVIQFQD